MQPPCLMPRVPLNECAKRLYAEKVLGHVDLGAEFAGWRIRGRWMISPDGDRITVERLRGLLFLELNERRRHRAGSKGQQGAKVIRIRGSASATMPAGSRTD